MPEIVKEELDIIVFERLWETLEQRQISIHRLREKCEIDRKTIRRLKANENVETKTLNKICSFLQCPLKDIAEFIPDNNDQ